MVFSTKVLSQSKDIIKRNNNYHDKSFFVESLNIISEDNNSFIAKSHHEYLDKNIFKSKEIIINTLDQFIFSINNLYQSFIEFMQNNSKNNICYNTSLGICTGYTSLKNELNKEFCTLIDDLSKFDGFKSYDGLYGSIQKIKNDIDFSQKDFYSIRGKCLGCDEPVDDGNFVAVLSSFVTNGIKESSCDISYNRVLEILKKECNDMIETAKDIKDKFVKLDLYSFYKDNIPTEAKDVFSDMLINKSIRIKKLCNLYTMILGAKIDAYKQLFLQDVSYKEN